MYGKVSLKHLPALGSLDRFCREPDGGLGKPASGPPNCALKVRHAAQRGERWGGQPWPTPQLLGCIQAPIDGHNVAERPAEPPSQQPPATCGQFIS